ncbi:PEP-CTERM sorting domain-containing protein [Lentimonas sp. CC10]|nr:PEP-CTERM sorting domain-containing protein [Lentimonas sp. CC10]
MKKTIHTLGLLTLFATSSQASTIIGIDFGSTAPIAGSNFNQYSDVIIAAGATESFAGTLIDTTGASVAGVGFTVQNNAASLQTVENVNLGVEGAGLLSDVSIYGDAIVIGRDNGTSDDSLTFTFTGLNDALTYDLLGGFDQDAATHNTTWAVDGQSVTTDNTIVGGGFASFTGLSTDGLGNLVITVTEANRFVSVSGLTLTAIPEPGTYALLAGIFGLSFVMLRRR